MIIVALLLSPTGETFVHAALEERLASRSTRLLAFTRQGFMKLDRRPALAAQRLALGIRGHLEKFHVADAGGFSTGTAKARTGTFTRTLLRVSAPADSDLESVDSPSCAFIAQGGRNSTLPKGFFQSHVGPMMAALVTGLDVAWLRPLRISSSLSTYFRATNP